MDNPRKLVVMGQSLGRNAVAMAVLAFYLFAVVVTTLAMFVATTRIGIFLQREFRGHLTATPWDQAGDATIGVVLLTLTAVVGFGAVAVIGLCLRWVFNAFFDGPLRFPSGDLWVGVAGLLGVAGLSLIWSLPIWRPVLPALGDTLASIAPAQESRSALSVGASVLPLAGMSLWFINKSSIAAGSRHGDTNRTGSSGLVPESTRQLLAGNDGDSGTNDMETPSQESNAASSTDDVGDPQPHHESTESEARWSANRSSPESQESHSTGHDSPRIDPDELEYDWQLSTEVTMDDVGGMEDVKRSLHRKIIGQMKSHEMRESAARLDISLPNLLLYGPPGTGKTHLAMALANEVELPFVKLTGGDITTKWINESSDKVNTLFNEGQQIAAMEGGAVIFLDEMDAVLSERGGSMNNRENQKVVNEFLGHLSETSDHDILFIGATNRRDDLDPAVTRRGRFDEEVEVPKPDEDARKAIFKAQLRNRPHELTDGEFERLATETDDLVAADIEAIVDEAARNLLYNSEGRERLRWSDFEVALGSEEDW